MTPALYAVMINVKVKTKVFTSRFVLCGQKATAIKLCLTAQSKKEVFKIKTKVFTPDFVLPDQAPV